MTRDPRTRWNDAEPEDEAGAGIFRPWRAESESTVPCPPPELVQASQMGTLPAGVQERVVSHVRHCVVCQALGEALDDQSVGSLTPDERARILTRVRTALDRPRDTFVRSRLWLSAAAAVALVTLGSVLWQSRSTPAPVAQGARQPDASSVFQLEKPAIGARAGSDLVWRGSDSRAAEELNRALEPYHADDFGGAARRLRTLVSLHPQGASGHFYLGVSNLFLGADAAAVTSLENAERLAKDDADLTRETAWYLALAYRRTGQTERAVGKLTGLCRGTTSRAARACAGLNELSAGSSAPRSR